VRHDFQHGTSIAIDTGRGYVFRLVKYVLAHDAAMDTRFFTQLSANLDFSYNQSGRRLTDPEE
jgi:hypothetical protein